MLRTRWKSHMRTCTMAGGATDLRHCARRGRPLSTAGTPRRPTPPRIGVVAPTAQARGASDDHTVEFGSGALSDWQSYGCGYIYAPFFACTGGFIDGGDIRDGRFGKTLRDMIANTEKHASTCPEAFALAHIVTVLFLRQLTEPFGTHLETPIATQYFHNVESAAFQYVRRAMNILFNANILPSNLTRVALAEALGPPPVGVMHRQFAARERLFAAAVEDHLWNEVWIPMDPRGDWMWGVPNVRSFVPQSLKTVTTGDMMRWGTAEAISEDATDTSVEHWVPLQHAALKRTLRMTLRILSQATADGILDAYWPTKSTLLALLRYGGLFGFYSNFHGFRADCVGDDIEIALAVTSVKRWATLVHWMTAAFVSTNSDFTCSLGGQVSKIVSSGMYDLLHCYGYDDGWFVSVQMAWDVEYYEFPFMGRCSAYGEDVPCRMQAAKQLTSKYGGCVALPNLTFTALTTGTDCVEWMSDGLSPADVAELQHGWLEMRRHGFLSMIEIWEDSDACRQVDASQAVSVGSINKTALAQQYHAVQGAIDCRPGAQAACDQLTWSAGRCGRRSDQSTWVEEWP